MMGEILAPGASAAILAAFLASFVEFVEALTIVLAVGITRGWRASLTGAAAGVGALAILVALLGPAIQRVPIALLQSVVGVLLLLFGMRWLRKATLRSAGVIAMHDEAQVFKREVALLSPSGSRARDMDGIAMLTSFKAVMLEGLEVIVIVVAAGAGGQVIPAAVGAALAGLIVIVLGVLLRHPLTKVPENALKMSVGALLSAFGVFWFGEGRGYVWPHGELSLIALVAGFLLLALAMGTLLRRSRAVTA